MNFDSKYHFHCVRCNINLHLNFIPKFCIWCGVKFEQLIPLSTEGMDMPHIMNEE